MVETIKKINSRKIVIFGANGMLGHALREVVPDAIQLGHPEIDITDAVAVKKMILRENPFAVINAAAYTDVDGCEENQDLAGEVNGRLRDISLRHVLKQGHSLSTTGTDYVFDGTRWDYREDDLPNPINAYGKSKLLGEISIQKNLKNYRIIRTSWLFGSHGKNFVDTILSLSRHMSEVRVVNDQIGKPTYTVDLARATPGIISRAPGIYHITNDGLCSWYEFAHAFIPNAVPCTTTEFPRRAKRPAYSVLVNTKTPPLRHWREAVLEYIHAKERT